MNLNDIDQILLYQLTVARLGEKELNNWWNTDMTYEVGGATFLQDLLGKTMAPLAAGEGILEAARLKDVSLLEALPQGVSHFSLFQPEPGIQTALKERMRHFKRYPEDVPDPIREILDPRVNFTPEQLKGRVPAGAPLEKGGTSFGYEVPGAPGNPEPGFFQSLAAALMECEKSRYILHYYTGDTSVPA